MSNFLPCLFMHVSPPHDKRFQQQQCRASLPWPSPILVVTVFFFSLLNHGTSVVANLDASGQYASQDNLWPPSNCDPSSFQCSMTEPGTASAPPPPMPGNGLQPADRVPHDLSPPPNEFSPGFPPPPSKVPPGPYPPLPGSPRGPETPTGDESGTKNKDQPQLKGEPQKSKRSTPKVVATVGWVFLAAAGLMQVALGGFLAYKRWEVEQYGVRLEKRPA